MKIALAFWGLTRSLKYTLPSIKSNILDILKLHNLTIFLHTYKFEGKYNNPRAKEDSILLDFEEYKLLNPDFIEIDNQDDIKTMLNVNEYKQKPDPWKTNYVTVENFICAMYSKSRLVYMINASRIQFDYIIFLRPDVKYLNPIKISFFGIANEKTIVVPDFHRYSNFNDRFCIATHKNGLVYGDLFKFMLEYSKQNQLHSETFQNYYITKIFKLSVKFIPFYFNRVRADGRMQNDCPHIK